MKKKAQLIIAIFIIALLASCGGGDKEISVVKLIPVKSGKDFQYIDKEGKIIINPQFGEATVFRNNLALVKTSGDEPKWGYISEDGKYVITAKYKNATVFSEDMAWVVSENSVPTAINAKGEIKITLQDAQTVKIFKDGLAAYSVSDSSGIKWGFVDKDGKIIINLQFSATGNFNDKKCAVENKDGKWGYIDKEGKILINYQFDLAKEFVNGKAVVVSGGKSGLIDENGKYLINPQFSKMVIDKDMFLIEQDGKWGWCDKDGKITINPQFSAAFPFLDNDLAAVQSGKSYGYIDKDGKIVITPQFDIALPFNGKLAMVSSSSKAGFIDKEGKYVINPQFDDVSDDFVTYMLYGSSNFESVETDFAKIPTDGLVAFYPFNGNANDESGNANNGTVYGATLTSDRNGKSKSAYSFNGSSDYIDCGNSSSFNVNYLSISAWINISKGGCTNKLIIGKVNPEKYESINLFVASNNNISTSFATGSEINHDLIISSILDNDKWYHIVLIYDGSYIKCYLNGLLDKQISRYGIVRTNNNKLAIGRHGADSGASDSYFNGMIDNVRIYNRALNEKEIRALYNEKK